MSCSDLNWFNGEKCCYTTSTVPESPPPMIPELFFQDPTEENPKIPKEVYSFQWHAPDDSKEEEEEIPFQQWVLEEPDKVFCPRGLNDLEFYGLYYERV